MTLTRHFVSFVPLCGPKCICRDMRLHPSVFYSPVVLRRLEKADVISGGAAGGVRNGSTGQVTAGAGGFAYNTRTDTGVAVGTTTSRQKRLSLQPVKRSATEDKQWLGIGATIRR